MALMLELALAKGCQSRFFATCSHKKIKLLEIIIVRPAILSVEVANTGPMPVLAPCGPHFTLCYRKGPH